MLPTISASCVPALALRFLLPRILTAKRIQRAFTRRKCRSRAAKGIGNRRFVGCRPKRRKIKCYNLKTFPRATRGKATGRRDSRASRSVEARSRSAPVSRACSRAARSRAERQERRGLIGFRRVHGFTESDPAGFQFLQILCLAVCSERGGDRLIFRC